MRKAMMVATVGLALCTGCSSSPDTEQFDAALTQLESVSAELKATNSRIDRIVATLHQLDQDVKTDQIPALRRDIDALRTSLSNVNRISGQAEEVLNVVSRKGDALVVPEMIISDGTNAMRCTLTPHGLSILNDQGQQVCELRYAQEAGAMTAELRGSARNSIALYAGDERAAIGAFDVKDGGLAMEHVNNGKQTSTSLKLVKSNGEVGWAATVTPRGEVFAGKARLKPVSKPRDR